jgi:hypothetical protein
MEASGENPSFEGLYLIGVRLHPDPAGVQLYTLLLMCEDARGGKDRPLADAEDYILWFVEPDLASHAMTLGDAGFRKHPVPAEVEATYDFPRLFWAVAEGPAAPSGHLAEALNLLLDLVDATGFTLPAAYRKDLHALADHLTFTGDVESFVEGAADVRARLMEAITWCVGAVTIKSTLVRDSGAPSA